MKTISIKNTEAVVGDIIHFQGARFEVVFQREVVGHQQAKEGSPVVANTCKWLSGHVEPNYFSPETNWVMQGNERRIIQIEPRT